MNPSRTGLDSRSRNAALFLLVVFILGWSQPVLSQPTGEYRPRLEARVLPAAAEQSSFLQIESRGKMDCKTTVVQVGPAGDEATRRLTATAFHEVQRTVRADVPPLQRYLLSTQILSTIL